MKSKISAEIIADSLSEQGHRLTTFLVVFPRIILAELNTHRMFSRNSASSRAVPFNKMLEKVEANPFIPIKFQKDHKGMQGTEYLSGRNEKLAVGRWLAARDCAVAQARLMNHNIGVTKQLCNRLLEPFMYHTAIITATEFENFFALRAEEAAEIHIQKLAYEMLEAYNKSEPKRLSEGEWHIPFGDKIDYVRLGEDSMQYYRDNPDEVVDLDKWTTKVATARCARLSYFDYEGKDDYSADFKLHDRLATMGHFSPFEHCAKVMSANEYVASSISSPEYSEGVALPNVGKNSLGWSGNLRGFIQYRKMFDNENREDYRVEHLKEV